MSVDVLYRLGGWCPEPEREDHQALHCLQAKSSKLGKSLQDDGAIWARRFSLGLSFPTATEPRIKAAQVQGVTDKFRERKSYEQPTRRQGEGTGIRYTAH